MPSSRRAGSSSSRAGSSSNRAGSSSNMAGSSSTGAGSSSTGAGNSDATTGATVYNTTKFAELRAQSQNPPVENLGLASKYIVSLLQRNGIACAIMGGWAIYLRGGRRSSQFRPVVTQNLDIAVAGNKIGFHMQNLRSILMTESRLWVPVIYGERAIQIFVRAGGELDGHWHYTTERPISVFIIMGGSEDMGAPPELPAGSELVYTGVQTTQAPIIDLNHQFSAKLLAFFSRRYAQDYADLEFLVLMYGGDIFNSRDSWDFNHRRAFLDAFAEFHNNRDSALTWETLGQFLGLIPVPENVDPPQEW